MTLVPPSTGQALLWYVGLSPYFFLFGSRTSSPTTRLRCPRASPSEFLTNLPNSIPRQEGMTGSHQHRETSSYQSQAPRNQQARAITPRGSGWVLPLRSPFYKLALWPTHTSPPMVVLVLVTTAGMSSFRHPQYLSICLNSLSQRVTVLKCSYAILVLPRAISPLRICARIRFIERL